MIKNHHCWADAARPVFFTILSSFLGDAALLWVYRDREPSLIEIQLPVKIGSPVEKIVARYPGAEQKLHPSLHTIKDQIEASLRGESVHYCLDVLDWDCCYEFQRKVLRKAFEIPRGNVVSYGYLAEKTGAPGAARAVGNAMARNPFPLVLPCHRVVRSSGHLGNFGGGVDMKRALLFLEGVDVGRGDVVDRRFFW